MSIKIFIMSLSSFIAVNGFAQDNKERGNTDYTNNRTKGKAKNTDNAVNTDRKTPVKIIEYIPGKWAIEQVLRGQEDVTATDTLAQNQTLEFGRENRYRSYSGEEQIDSGMFRINEQQAILYLESESTDKPTEWNIWFDPEGTMKLKRREGQGTAANLSYIYRRTGAATSKR
jgi:hypothetical protein